MTENLIREVNARELTLLISGTRPVLVTFYAPWYASYEAVNTMLERLAERFAGRIEVVKVDADENRHLAAELAVRGVVTLLLFAGGEIVARHIGAGGEVSLVALIEAQVEDKADNS